MKSMIQSAFNITENPFDKSKMRLMGIVHIKAHLLKGIEHLPNSGSVSGQ